MRGVTQQRAAARSSARRRDALHGSAQRRAAVHGSAQRHHAAATHARMRPPGPLLPPSAHPTSMGRASQPSRGRDYPATPSRRPLCAQPRYAARRSVALPPMKQNETKWRAVNGRPAHRRRTCVRAWRRAPSHPAPRDRRLPPQPTRPPETRARTRPARSLRQLPLRATPAPRARSPRRRRAPRECAAPRALPRMCRRRAGSTARDATSRRTIAHCWVGTDREHFFFVPSRPREDSRQASTQAVIHPSNQHFL